MQTINMPGALHKSSHFTLIILQESIFILIQGKEIEARVQEGDSMIMIESDVPVSLFGFLSSVPKSSANCGL